MSREARDWVWEEAPVTDPRQLLILLSLADVANEHGGGAYPSKARLARDARSDQRTVQRHLQALVNNGVLVVEEESRQHRPTTYGFVELLARGDRLTPLDKPNPRQGRHRGDTGETNGQRAPYIGIGTGTKTLASLFEQPPATNGTSAPEPGFDDFWEHYPRKMAKEDARKAWAQVTRQIPPQAIVDGARRFATDPNLPSDRQYIPYPATWLRAGRWNDESLPPRNGPRARDQGITDRSIPTGRIQAP